jgi:hypothetical protein
MLKILPNLCVHIPPPAKGTFIINVSSSICPVPGRKPGTDCQRVVEKLESKYPDIIREVMVIPDRIEQTDQICIRNIHFYQIKNVLTVRSSVIFLKTWLSTKYRLNFFDPLLCVKIDSDSDSDIFSIRLFLVIVLFPCIGSGR